MRGACHDVCCAVMNAREENTVPRRGPRVTRPIPVHTVDVTASNKEEFSKPFHIILNLALSEQFTGNAQPNQANFPLSMLADYVRGWQRIWQRPTRSHRIREAASHCAKEQYLPHAVRR
jgi:hypothetical protein